MARHSWAATSSDTVDGSDRSAKNSLRFSTHSVSWKGSTGVVPFQAFLQLSTVRLYSFFAPKECGMAGLQGVNVNQARRVAPEPDPKRYLPATRTPSRRGAYRRVGLAAGSRPRSRGRPPAPPLAVPRCALSAGLCLAREDLVSHLGHCLFFVHGLPFPLGLFLPPPLRVFYPYRC